MTSLIIQYYYNGGDANNNPIQFLHSIQLKKDDAILHDLVYADLDHLSTIDNVSYIKKSFPLNVEYSALVLEYSKSKLIALSLIDNDDFLLSKSNAMGGRNYDGSDTLKIYPIFGKRIQSVKKIEIEPFIEFIYTDTLNRSYINLGMLFLLISFITPVLYYLFDK